MTDEPGYYDEERGFGVRIENTLHILGAAQGRLNERSGGGQRAGEDAPGPAVPSL